jgi:hypothetical protein
VFDNLAIGKAADIDTSHDNWGTTWPDSEPSALVGSAPRHLCDDQIAFGDLRFDRELEIRKGLANALQMLFVPFDSGGLIRISRDVIVCQLSGKHVVEKRFQLGGINQARICSYRIDHAAPASRWRRVSGYVRLTYGCNG